MSRYNKKKLEEQIKKKNAKKKEEYENPSSGYEASFSKLMSSQIHPLPLSSLIDAPEDWNFYSKLSNEKMLELVESIEKLGLMHPIVVWEKDGKYMILSGHNRKKAYEILSKKNNEYNQIPSIIKRAHELTVEEAKGIIVDTNFAQRRLSPGEISKSIMVKYKELKNSNNLSSTETQKILSEHFNMTMRNIRRYHKLRDLNLYFSELFSANKLSLRSALFLSDLSIEIQDYLSENHTVTNETVQRLNKAKIDPKTVTKEEIDSILNEKIIKEFEEIKIKVPAELKEEILRAVEIIVSQSKKKD